MLNNTLKQGKFQVKNIIKYIFIGFIQGITEFLPVSSSGHIVLFGSFFELDNLLLISVVAHIGTLFAVIFCYRKRLKELITKPKNPTNLNLIIATIPTVIGVLLFNDFIESRFGTNSLVWGFLISAILLLIADLKKDGTKCITKKSAIYMGISQAFAILPGFSRSGTTLVCGMMSGVNKQEALDFSFLMSIPIIIASAVWEGFDLISSQITINYFGILIVMLSSFIFGILSIKIMLKTLKKNKLFYFSIYLVLLAIVTLLLF